MRSIFKSQIIRNFSNVYALNLVCGIEGRTPERSLWFSDLSAYIKSPEVIPGG